MLAKRKKNMSLKHTFGEVKKLIDEARHRALKAVNTELVMLYWNIGQYLNTLAASASWGEGVVDRVADYLATEGPEYRGFNRRNLYRMKQFYEAYHDNEIVSPLVTQLSWTHNLIILSKTKTDQEREFYIKLAIKEHYTKRELERQIDSAVYERTALSTRTTLPSKEKTAPAETAFRDTYVFEFLDLHEQYSERDLQRGLVKNLRIFLLEIGRDFIFIGEEYRVQVGLHDYYIDLLFYHRELQCLVAFELKIEEFKPEHLGKLNFYLEALDRDVKKPHENPSIGVLLCKGKDKEVVEYALSRNLSPAMVSEYQLKLPDKDMLRKKLHELFEQLPRGESPDA